MRPHSQRKGDKGYHDAGSNADHLFLASLRVVAISEEDTYTADYSAHGEQEGHNEEGNERADVALTDAVVQRHAVVVPALDAMPALSTVRGFRVAREQAGVAVSELVVNGVLVDWICVEHCHLGLIQVKALSHIVIAHRL